ncbi:CidA/LrgA family protein [Alteribacillus bidgolensis]|uniref:Holin-like protein n=1 Tax=Alteribacillus bidgolensis TaxID=930129 RepID=A0A1G8HDU5_9BACI|nr:CidA/LrgA family protein [Alteribacillus bidgolensis]SDI04824.1 holin-like protein [Alteribacillus bidgolensis]
MLEKITQWLILLGIYFIGSSLSNIFHLPLPGSIIGMMLLFVLLLSGLFKLQWVEKVAQLHLKHMTLLFIPFIVGVFLSLDIFRVQGWKLLFVLVITSLIVLLGTAYTCSRL